MRTPAYDRRVSRALVGITLAAIVVAHLAGGMAHRDGSPCPSWTSSHSETPAAAPAVSDALPLLEAPAAALPLVLSGPLAASSVSPPLVC